MTKSRKSTTLGLSFAASAIGLLLAGCAATSTGGKPEDVVRERATERAQAFVKGDFARSYKLTSPTYRSLRTEDAYKLAFGPLRWERAEVQGVICEPQRCKVDLTVGLKPLIRGRIGDTISVQFQEIWVLEDGNWWLHQAL